MVSIFLARFFQMSSWLLPLGMNRGNRWQIMSTNKLKVYYALRDLIRNTNSGMKVRYIVKEANPSNDADSVVDKTHIIIQNTRGQEWLGLNDECFIVTAQSNNITWVGLQRTLQRTKDSNYIPIVSFSQHALGQSQCSKLWAFLFSISIYLPAPAVHNTLSYTI